MSRSRHNELCALAVLLLMAVALLALDVAGALGGWLVEPVDISRMR